MRGVLVHHAQHLLVYLVRRDLATEHAGAGEVAVCVCVCVCVCVGEWMCLGDGRRRGAREGNVNCLFHRDLFRHKHTYVHLPSMARVSSAHHVLSIKCLCRQLRQALCAIDLRPLVCKRSKAHTEKMKARERDHVHRQLCV